MKRLIDRVAYRYADHSAVVSQALVGIALAHGADPARVTTIRQFIPTPRSTDRPDLPPADVVNVTSAVDAYQSPGESAALLGSLADRLQDVSFGWLDGAFEGDLPVAMRPNLWRARIRPDAVQGVLERARVGLVIRSAGPSNATAAPTKVAQYRAAGCAIVTGPNPPSAAEVALDAGGEVITDPDDPDAWAGAVRAVLQRPKPRPADYGEHVVDQWTALIDRVTR